jgi:LysR family glycine cleavage system transcriptional activator
MSVKRAAAELNVTPAAVSHQVRSLEEYLGVPLFRRYHRALELTDAARACLPKLREGFDCLAKAVEVLRAQKGTGTLTVSVAPSLAARWLMPRLHRFLEAHPEIDVRVSARMRHVSEQGRGHVAERATVEGWLADSDIAILYGRGDYPGFSVDKLLSLTVTPICSPRLLAGPTPLAHPEDLHQHALLHDETGDLYDGESFWDVWLKAAGVEGVDTRRGARFSHAVLACEAATEGLGVLATMPVLAAADLQAGRLVTPFTLRVPLVAAYYLVSSPAAVTRPEVAAFRTWVREEARREEEV